MRTMVIAGRKTPPRGQPPLPPWRMPGTEAGGLTADLQQEVYRRLQAITTVMFLLSLLYLVLGLFVIPRFPPLAALRMPPYSHLIFVAAMVVSAAVFAIARSRVFPPRQTSSLGLVYEVGIAFLMAVWYTVARAGVEGAHAFGISWVCIWILFYPMVVPSTRSRTFAAAMLAASMDPLLGYLYFGAVRGTGFPPSLLLLWKENFICAVLAVVPAHILWQMGRQVGRARELGNYELLRRLGVGGMGEVWEARHRNLAKRVAVKIIRPEALGGLDEQSRWLTLRQFEREAQATARLQSPHTIAVYDYGLGHDGTFYYVMEYLEGFDLDTWVRRFGPMSPPRTAWVLRQAAHSLADAHERGLIHRDVKPANIYLCRRGRDADFVKVLDFGLVINNARRGHTPDPVQDHETNLPGTPDFMAPEQAALSPQEIDHRADVYSLGCVGYWLMTGRPVFSGEAPREILCRHAAEAPVSPSERAERSLCRCLEGILLRCLAKDPADRPESMEALVRAIDRCPFPERWSNERARAWWKAHVETGPITTPVARSGT